MLEIEGQRNSTDSFKIADTDADTTDTNPDDKENPDSANTTNRYGEAIAGAIAYFIVAILCIILLVILPIGFDFPGRSVIFSIFPLDIMLGVALKAALVTGVIGCISSGIGCLGCLCGEQ